jgi:hypothetical protein
MADGTTLIAPKTGAAYLLPESGVDSEAIRIIIHDMGLRNDLPLEDNTRWLKDLEKAIPAAIAIYGNMKRRYGDVPVGTHAIWTANKTYNDFLHRYGHEKALLAAFIQLMHDRIEDGRERAKKLGLIFDETKTLDAICDLWRSIKPNAPEEDFTCIREDIRWMTDEDPNLSGKLRINAQIDKSFESNKCNLSITRQRIRFNDKLHHIMSDVEQRKAFIRYRNAGKPLPTDPKEQRRYGVPDDKVRECHSQGNMKAYVLDFPNIPLADKIKYQLCLAYLHTQALEVDLRNSFKQAMNLVSRRKEAIETHVIATHQKPQPAATYAL